MKHIREYWRPIAAVVYLTICLFDFIIMPVMFLNSEQHKDYSKVYIQVNKLNTPQAQVALLNKINYNVSTWQPLTLGGGGMFHIAFGALLTGAAITRGLEKKAIVENG